MTFAISEDSFKRIAWHAVFSPLVLITESFSDFYVPGQNPQTMNHFVNSEILILISLWVVYFTLHSVLASAAVKNLAFRWLRISRRVYRLQYVIFSTASLFGLLLYAASLPADYLFGPNVALRFLGLVLAGWGIIIVKKAFGSYDGRAFLGLGELGPEEDFRDDGLLKYVRHPLYAGSMLLIVGFFLFIPTAVNLISVLLVINYFLIGIQFEERRLIRRFGGRYLRYRSNTPMLIPDFSTILNKNPNPDSKPD